MFTVTPLRTYQFCAAILAQRIRSRPAQQTKLIVTRTIVAALPYESQNPSDPDQITPGSGPIRNGR
jgi:hypothetical protein